MNTIVSKLESVKPPKFNQLTKGALKNYFNNTWELYEMLFSAIKSDETYYLSPDPLRNPLIFYLGHTAAFYVNKFKLAGMVKEGVDEHFDRLFAVGVDPDLPQNLDVSSYWPTVEEVRVYRKTIYQLIHSVIDATDWRQSPVNQDSPLWVLMMTIEHDRIHFETSSVLIRQLAVDLIERPEGWNYAPTFGRPAKNEWIDVKGGSISFGKPENSDIFGWDDEFGTFTSEVKPFSATKNLMTNADFMEFVNSNGYEDRSCWSEEGREWKNRTGTTLPKFWIASGDLFLYRAMFDELEMPLDWPVEVNAHEAQAYCTWRKKGIRLLSEAEFLFIAREGMTDEEDPLYTHNYNLNFVYGSPTPVGYLKKGVSAAGFNDLYGNVWDWLKDDFYPLNGFKTHPLYEEFSAPYMDQDHGMMAGGSWITTGTGASKYYRLWFRRHFFQHAGFRLASDL